MPLRPARRQNLPLVQFRGGVNLPKEGRPLTFVLFLFSLLMTRGDILRYAIAYALLRARKIVRGLKQGLSEDERHAVAEHVVRQLKAHGDPWGLSQEGKPGRGHETGSDWTPRGT